MDRKFALSWDPVRPVALEVLYSGAWSDEDSAVYLAELPRFLLSAPPGGFDLISDARSYTMQVDSESDHVAYDMLADAGCRRLVMVATKTSIVMQTMRMIRESASGRALKFEHAATMDEAEAIVAQWYPV